MTQQFRISCCDADQRSEALCTLHDGLPEELRSELVHTLHTVGDKSGEVFSGLLVASAAQELEGVAWAQLTAGKTAVLWPPAATSPSGPALMEAVAVFLDDNEVALAQLLSNPSAPPNLNLLAAGGFRELAKLAYLTLDKDFFPQVKPPGVVEFEPHASESPDRLGNLLLQTYQDTLDCPQLNGIREPAEIIEGYAAQGTFSSDRWFFAQIEGEDVGALILTQHADGESWELIYMGVTPTGRGQGLGWQILQYALWQAYCGDAQRLVLAVDESNKHALAHYRKAGFTIFDRRTVFARLAPNKRRIDS